MNRSKTLQIVPSRVSREYLIWREAIAAVSVVIWYMDVTPICYYYVHTYSLDCICVYIYISKHTVHRHISHHILMPMLFLFPPSSSTSLPRARVWVHPSHSSTRCTWIAASSSRTCTPGRPNPQPSRFSWETAGISWGLHDIWMGFDGWFVFRSRAYPSYPKLWPL